MRAPLPPVARARRTAAAVLVVVATLLAMAGPAGADDLDNKRQATQSALSAAQQQQSSLQDSLEDLQGQAAMAAAQLVSLQAQLPAAQQALADAQATLTAAQRQADILAGRLANAQDQATDLAASIAADAARTVKLRAAIAQMGREAYASDSELSGLNVVLDATSTQDFIDSYAQVTTALRAQDAALSDLAALTASNTSAQDRLTAVQGTITDLKAQADAQVAAAAAAKQAAAAAKSALDDLTAQVTAQQAVLTAQAADVQAQLAAADQASATLKSQLDAIIAQEAAQQGSSAGISVDGAIFSNPTVHTPMVVTSEYGMRWQPILHIYRLHAGIDLRSYCGEPIFAARAGKVQWSEFRPGYGNQVMVDHGRINGTSVMSSYSHLTRAVVSAGQTVSTGQLVGYAGATGGISTGCHLHFEVYINGNTVNPRPYLGL